MLLMGLPTDQGVTHLDVAVAANCKQFMNKAGPKQFLEKLWRHPNSNGDYVQARVPSWLSAPR